MAAISLFLKLKFKIQEFLLCSPGSHLKQSSQGRAATVSPSLVSPLRLRSLLPAAVIIITQRPTLYQSQCPNVHTKSFELDSKL